MDLQNEASNITFKIVNEKNLIDLKRKVNSITKSISKPYYNKILHNLLKINPTNTEIIYDYIITEQTELHIKDSTIETKIKILVWLSNFHKKASFKEVTKKDILGYLNNSRKSHTEDPASKWVGIYNSRQMILLKFFKWLYYPDDDYRKKINP